MPITDRLLRPATCLGSSGPSPAWPGPAHAESPARSYVQETQSTGSSTKAMTHDPFSRPTTSFYKLPIDLALPQIRSAVCMDIQLSGACHPLVGSRVTASTDRDIRPTELALLDCAQRQPAHCPQRAGVWARPLEEGTDLGLQLHTHSFL